MTVASTPHLRRAGILLTIASLIAIGLATMLPEPPAPPRSHLCLACGMYGGVNGLLNVLLFVPLGVGLALWESSGKRAVLLGCLLSILIETTQLWIPGRYSNIGDVITNALGVAVGFAVARYARVWLMPTPRAATRLFLGWCTIWLAIQAASNFAFTIAVPDSIYYGQLARELGHFAVFRGRVFAATIDGIPIPDTRISDAETVGYRLRRGAEVEAVVVPGGLTVGLAPIVRIADAKQREIVLLAQYGRDLVYGIRTGASILRLRPPFFALREAFTDSTANVTLSAGDTLHLSGQYDGRAARLDARAALADQSRQLRVSASLGWTLLWPSQWLIEDSAGERVLSWIWMAALILPVGYWGACARSAAPRATLLVAIGCGLLTILGLVVMPQAFSLSTAPARDWLAALAGIVAGGAVALTGALAGSALAHHAEHQTTTGGNAYQ